MENHNLEINYHLSLSNFNIKKFFTVYIPDLILTITIFTKNYNNGRF